MSDKEIFEDLYKNIDGFKISRESKTRMNSKDPELVYGEITFDAMAELIKRLPDTKSKVFYDLGSGTGKITTLAALLGNFSKIVGVELIAELCEVAEQVRRRLAIILAKRYSDKKQQPPQLVLIHDNILAVDFSDADFIFVPATCLSDSAVMFLNRRLTMLKRDAIIISLSRPLNRQQFEVYGELPLKFSWGLSKIFLQKRRG